jgi:hypothetical protein
VSGVYSVNPLTKQSTGVLANFVCSTASTINGNLFFSPGMVTSGAYQNVSGAPATGATITFLYGTAAKTFAQNLCYDRNAFSFASVPLALPDGAPYKARQRVEGVDLRMIKSYQVLTDVDVCRCDVLFGIDATLPEFAVRIPGVGV